MQSNVLSPLSISSISYSSAEPVSLASDVVPNWAVGSLICTLTPKEGNGNMGYFIAGFAVTLGVLVVTDVVN